MEKFNGSGWWLHLWSGGLNKLFMKETLQHKYEPMLWVFITTTPFLRKPCRIMAYWTAQVGQIYGTCIQATWSGKIKSQDLGAHNLRCDCSTTELPIPGVRYLHISALGALWLIQKSSPKGTQGMTLTLWTILIQLVIWPLPPSLLLAQGGRKQIRGGAL